MTDEEVTRQRQWILAEARRLIDLDPENAIRCDVFSRWAERELLRSDWLIDRGQDHYLDRGACPPLTARCRQHGALVVREEAVRQALGSPPARVVTPTLMVSPLH